MSIKQILIDTKTLIDTPEKWVKGVSSTRKNGVDCYCITGALHEAVWPTSWNYHEAYMTIFDAIDDHIIDGIINFNDSPSTTHDDVMKVMDKAIEKAQ